MNTNPSSPPQFTAQPKRVQLRRTKGWRMPPNTVSVARPTKWGNPFRAGDATIPTVKDAVHRYRRWIADHMVVGPQPPDPSELRGKNLACWCPLNQPCHATVLLELANQSEEKLMPDSPHTADIVERLNATWKHDAYIATNRTSPPIKGEVERLINPDGPEAAAEIKALREALRKIDKHDSGVSDNLTECENCHDAYLEPYVAVKRIARAALKDHRKVP